MPRESIYFINVISSEISVLITVHVECGIAFAAAFLSPTAKPNIVLDHVKPAYEISRH
jgi:hypothetical protein